MNTAGVRGANSHQNQKSKYNLESALSICGSSTSADSTNPRSSGSIVFTTGKKKSAYKWICAAQIQVIEGSTVSE